MLCLLQKSTRAFCTLIAQDASHAKLCGVKPKHELKQYWVRLSLPMFLQWLA